MRDPQKAKPDLWEAGLAGKAENRGWLFLSSLRRLVNLHGLFFHLRPLAGLLTSGFWCERICLWIIVLDQAARLLRDVVGDRI